MDYGTNPTAPMEGDKTQSGGEKNMASAQNPGKRPAAGGDAEMKKKRRVDSMTVISHGEKEPADLYSEEMDSDNTESRAEDLSLHALSRYPSQGDVPPPNEPIATEGSSDIKCELLLRPSHTYIADGVLKKGDILKIEYSPGQFKRVEILDGEKKMRHITGTDIRTFLIQMAPGLLERSLNPIGLVQFPSLQRPETIRSPVNIWEAVQSVLPAATSTLERQLRTKTKKNAWPDTRVNRPGKGYVGTLDDFRLALQFTWNESDLQSQLTFSKMRLRNQATNYKDAGFLLTKEHGLYLKVATVRMSSIPMFLVIDLGTALNDELSSFAEKDYTIVMVDYRVMSKASLPVPFVTVKDRKVAEYGPRSFETAALRAVAGSRGWSMGHAFLGLNGLCHKSSSNGKDYQKLSAVEMGIFQYLYRQPAGKAPTIPDDLKTSWTPEEEAKVREYHSLKITGQLRHYPVPITRDNRNTSNIQKTQYCKSGDHWVVDKSVHLEYTGNEIIYSQAFEDAKTAKRTSAPTTAAKSRRSKYGSLATDAAPKEGRSYYGFETSGRGEESRTGHGRNGQRAYDMSIGKPVREEDDYDQAVSELPAGEKGYVYQPEPANRARARNDDSESDGA